MAKLNPLLQKMKRIVIWIGFALLGISGLWGRHISPETAQLVALNVFQGRWTGYFGSTEVKSVQTVREQGLEVIHIVNMWPEGCVLVSADDRVRPILAILPEGKYQRENLPPNLAFWLQEYARQIHHVIQHGIPSTPEIDAEWKAALSKPPLLASANPLLPPLPAPVVGPLLSTTWNQTCYYNADCPADGGGSCGRVYTGCGATAMAQVMKYHAWPATGLGSHSYTPSGYPLQSANFGATTYNWAVMPNNVTAANPAVAQLMSHCGITVNMQYSISSSDCFFSDLPQSLRQYFRYSLSANAEGKIFYSDPAWNAMLRTELDAARPMLYSGSIHFWVCDGYGLAPDLYHMNWGWGGLYNGWYALNNLNPGSLTFSNTGAVVGIKPVGPFEVEGNMASFSTGGGSVNFEVASDSDWVATASAPWFSFSVAGGTAGYFMAQVSAIANPTWASRSGFVALSRGSLRDTIWVDQDPIIPILGLSPDPIVEGSAGGSRTITVGCDSNWVVTFADPWLGYTPSAGFGNGSISLTIANNPGAGSRSGIVVVTRGGLTDTLHVNQDGTSAFWCVPALGPPTAVGATRVQVKTLDRTSAVSEGYVLATDSTILRLDSTYSLRVTFSGSVAPAVWIDWNQDGDFFDAGEAIVAPGGVWYPSFGGTKTVAFTIPSTATLGQTRMRVYVKTFPSPTLGPCEVTNVGDIEDFNIYIQNTTPLDWSPFPLVLLNDRELPVLKWEWPIRQVPVQFEVQRQQSDTWESLAQLPPINLEWLPESGISPEHYRIQALMPDGSLLRSNAVAVSAQELSFQLFPNPIISGNPFQIRLSKSSKQVDFRVWDAGGRMLRQDRMQNIIEWQCPTTGWGTGMYWIEVVSDGSRIIRKLLVN